MKILSYNIMSGGFNSYEYKTTKPQRLELIKRVIENVKADVVSLIDTFRWDEIYTTHQLCEMFYYKYAYCINLGDERLKSIGCNNGITVLSNVEVKKFETVNLITRNCVLTKLQTGQTTVDLFSLYLDDLSENTRLAQVKELEKHFDSESPTIIIGDLNSFSPENKEDTLLKIDKVLMTGSKYEGLKAQLYDMARAEVISELQRKGFKDTSTNFVNTFPTKLTGILKTSLVKVDFALVKNIESRKFEVLRGELVEKTSDHYPVLLETL